MRASADHPVWCGALSVLAYYCNYQLIIITSNYVLDQNITIINLNQSHNFTDFHTNLKFVKLLHP